MKNILTHHLVKVCVFDDVINDVKYCAFVIIWKERIFPCLSSKKQAEVSLSCLSC